MKILLLFSVAAAVFHVPSSSQQSEPGAGKPDVVGEKTCGARGSDKEPSGRLPTSLRPLHYILHLQPFLTGNLSIHGTVDIRLKVLHPTDKVVLNMADIITRNETVKVTCEGLEEVGVVRQTYEPTFQMYTAHLIRPLTTNTTCHLHMDFQGYLNDKLVGFYRSDYTDGQGNTRVVAGTQFSPTDARRAFPSLDEPALKATFDIHLARPQNMTALSSMPLLFSSPAEGQPGWVWDTFATTVPMSTYLVGFLVCDYSFLATPAATHNTTSFRVWTRTQALDQASYASSVAPALLVFLERYFQVPFPLPKLDMATLPDFKFGAMENWGLILYRESRLLYDPVKSSARSLQNVGVIIAHEIAHQWFGNLVTPAWWSDLWLKEGFATYMGYVALNATEPSWSVMDQFLNEELHAVLGPDSLLSTHPVSATVNHPDEISQMFDVISYKKGSSIIRMMQHFLTEATFRKGLKSYLEALKYASAKQDDLWEHLTWAGREDKRLLVEQAGSVKAVMDLWTLQKGYPIITITRNGTSATLTQDWFLLEGRSPDNATGGGAEGEVGPGWWVPISYTTQSSPDFHHTHPQHWMTPDKQPLTISGLPDENQWMVVNVQQTGYYRVNYDPATWRLLTAQLEADHTIIHTANRAQILNDAFNLARAELLDYPIALGTSLYLARERDLVPWRAALASFKHLLAMFGRSPGYGQLREYVRLMVVYLYDSVGFKDNPADPFLVRFKRAVAVNHACHLTHPPCLIHASQLFSDWLTAPHNDSILPGNMAYPVVCAGVGRGGEEAWLAAWGRYITSNVGSEKDTILAALGCTKEVWLLARYLDMAFTPGSGVRKQDAGKVFTAVTNNPIGTDLAWNYLQNGWNHILEYLGPGSTHLSRIVKAATRSFNTNLELAELERFKSDNMEHLGSASRAIDQALESTRINVKWMKRNYQSVVNWLATRGYSNSVPLTPQAL